MKLCLVVVVFVLCVSPSRQLNVAVYYKSTDHVSDTFVKRQLMPAIISPYIATMKVDLVPYLEGNTEAKMIKKCEESYSTKACITSKVHACVLETFKDYRNKEKFKVIQCLLHEGYDQLGKCNPYGCDQELLLSFCINSVDGDQLLMRNFNRTTALRIPLTSDSFPIVTFDGVYKQDEQQKARENLLGLLCEKYHKVFTGNHCDSPRARATMKHKNFFTNYYFYEQSCYEK